MAHETETDTTTPPPAFTPVNNLSGQLLLAMPGVIFGSLANAVIYVCEHNSHGALGLVINRPTDLTVGTLLQRIELELPLEINPAQDAPVFFGGPIQTDRGFVLHADATQYNSSLPVGGLMLTTSRDVLQEVAKGKGPQEMLITLGYAGWGSGQLEDEIAQNAWLNVNASEEILFHVPPAQRFEEALKGLGIRNATLMPGGMAGHA